MQNLNSKALSLSHQIKKYFTSWSEAMKAGWMLAKLFMGFPINITFAKSMGEIRTAKAIAVSSLSTIEKGFIRFVEMVDNKTQWRSFRIERLVF